MGWFSRRGTEPTKPDDAPLPPIPTANDDAPLPRVPDATADSSVEGHGTFGPRVRITAFTEAPPELTWQVPVRGELYRVMAGSDRPDYSLMLLERPLLFYPAPGFDVARVGRDRLVKDRKGRPMVQVHALVLGARFVGQQLHPGMVDLAVNVAYVIDQSLVRDTTVDPAKIEYAAIGLLTEGTAPGDGEPGQPGEPALEGPRPAALPPPVGEPTDLLAQVAREAARLLRQGVAERRGAHVETLQATITVDGANRISGLTGNADGSAPEPTPETFDRINVALYRLASLPPDRAVSSLFLRVAGEDITVDSTSRS